MNKVGIWSVTIALAGCATASEDTVLSPMHYSQGEIYPMIAPPQVLGEFAPDSAPDEEPFPEQPGIRL
jgi:hypothetical protein